MPLTRDQLVDAGPAQVFVQLTGPSSAQVGGSEPVVLLHEGLGSVAMWKDFPQRLADACGRRVLTYDRPGHGRSPPHDAGLLDLDHEAFVVLPALLRALNIERPILLGHSDGGTIALMAAARSDISAVIVEAAHVHMEDVMRAGIRRLVAEWNEGALRRRLARYHGPHVGRMFERWASTWLSEDFDSWAIVDHLRRITRPLLALQGASDGFGTIGQLDAIARHCAGAARTVLLPDCGHVPHHERPGDVLDIVANDLTERLHGRVCMP